MLPRYHGFSNSGTEEDWIRDYRGLQVKARWSACETGLNQTQLWHFPRTLPGILHCTGGRLKNYKQFRFSFKGALQQDGSTSLNKKWHQSDKTSILAEKIKSDLLPKPMSCCTPVHIEFQKSQC